ncbi:PAS domain-containing protein [Paenibacillus filicis]|uniref:PAS domain-containing protein n=1 Tax=Paenibacillus gyeongsangnamensis TaxID=3388067 RepID=A0ABT4Q3J6_9BACL|nr:CheR family methyltransferase [Paenibacillus filicis]MCZ8511412.1 PAS domain-containing protein [Paenibacillus filicis]
MIKNQAKTEQGAPVETNGIVGIGASACGLEALQQLFAHVEPCSGLSFIIIQHLLPDYISFMAEQFSKITSMQVIEAEDKMEVRPNCIYLIPPNKNMTIKNRVLQVTDHQQSAGLNLPIDLFLTSLAKEEGKHAIAVILSGTGSDGTRGMEAIKEHGGLVLVQDEPTAKSDGMTGSVRLPGSFDDVLNPRTIADYMCSWPVSMQNESHGATAPEEDKLLNEEDTESLLGIFTLLKQASGIDFSYYKQNSIVRRIERRIRLQNIAGFRIYVCFLESHPDEVSVLVKDLLIGITRFFRDSQAFEIMHRKVIPAIFDNKQYDRIVRVWVAGCSTGEEAYSLAILLREHMSRMDKPFTVKIFATDLDKDSIDFASQGIYPETALEDLPRRLVKTYFTRHGDVYSVNKDIRKMVVFAPHNITKDPPFSSLDLITCRNMLIYLQPEMQRKVISLFHFALSPSGFLFLGPSETLGRLSNLFTPYDRKWNIFQQNKMQPPMTYSSMSMNEGMDISRIHHIARRGFPAPKESPSYKKENDLCTVFADEHMPPCMVINEHNEVLHLSGNINPYLVLAQGKPSWNIYKMVEAHLAVAIVTAIVKVFKDRQPVVYKSLRVNQADHSPAVKVTVKPFSTKNKKFDQLVLVTFEETAEQPVPTRTIESFDIASNVNERIIELEQELQRAEESLQATIEELETSNEELQATNEELVAANEELMSANEELQSLNEELVTVNTEYQFKIQELTEVNNDLDNFLVSTKIGTIFLDNQMRVRRFTPAIMKEINLMEVDHGRPIGHISHNFKYDGILRDAKKVLKTENALEREIQSNNGKWYNMRVLPYRANDKAVKGIVLTFVDITELKSANEELLKLSYAIQQSPSIKVITDADGRVEYVNPKFTEVTSFQLSDVAGKHLRELNNTDSAGPAFREVWDAISSGREWKGELESRRSDGELYWESVKFLPIKNRKRQIIHYLKIAEDISDRKQTEELLRKSEMLSAVGQLAAGIAHEIRNPLTALKGFTKLMTSGGPNESYLAIMSGELERIEEIVSELLVLAKPQAVEFLPKPVPVILHDVLLLLDTQAIISNVQIETEIDDSLPMVNCVENQLKQVFINVVKNGVEAMASGGKMVIRAVRTEEGMLKISFTDNGSGIPAQTLAKLGEPFFTTKNKGTGLGLMVSYKIIENHQGKMTINSKEGAGTTVNIVLPLLG